MKMSNEDQFVTTCRLWLLSTALAALGGLWVASARQASTRSLTIERVRGDLYVIGGPQDANAGHVGMLVTPEGVILVDDKFERHVEAILDAVRTVTEQPVRYIFNTHHHLDHSGGNHLLRERAEIIAHRNARAHMVTKSASSGSGRPESDLPRVTFTDTTSVFLGGKEVRAHFFGRGHTDGDVVIYFPTERVIHTGDLFVPGGFLTDYAAGGSALEWDATLGGVLGLDFDVVIPGHGPTTVSRDVLVRHRQDFETVRQRVRELVAQGTSRNEVERLLKLGDLPGWSTVPWIPVAPRIARSFGGLYDELVAVGRQ